LGTLPGDNFSYAFGINNIGQVVGVSENIVGISVDHSLLYSNGVMMNLGMNFTYPFGINDIGQVVGRSDIVPIPATQLLFGSALIVMVAFGRRKLFFRK
jgi:probable HAF family extracellular repeat protein